MMHELSRFYGSFGARGVAASRTSLPPLSVGSGEDGERSSNDGGMSDPRLKVSCRLFFSVCFPLVGNGIFIFLGIFFIFLLKMQDGISLEVIPMWVIERGNHRNSVCCKARM